jgi:hypothetical protein
VTDVTRGPADESEAGERTAHARTDRSGMLRSVAGDFRGGSLMAGVEGYRPAVTGSRAFTPSDAGVSASSVLGLRGLSPTLIATLRGLRCSGLGIRISSTPRSKLACTDSGLTPSGSVSDRAKLPNARSTR